MGRALYSWEKDEREIERERDRIKNAIKVKSRRLEDQKQKEEIELLNTQIGQSSFDIFEASIQLLLIGGILETNIFRDLDKITLFDPIKISSLKVDVQIPSKKAIFNESDFKNDSKIQILKKQSGISQDDFIGSNGSFFEKLFFKSSLINRYNEFIENAELELKSKIQKNEERKEKFKSLLKNYEELIENNDLSLKDKAETAKENSKKKYEEFKIEISRFNQELSDLNEVVNAHMGDIEDVFFQYFFMKNVPLKFEKLDHYFSILTNNIKEFSDDYYKSPYEHLKIAVKFSKESIHFYILNDADYFPVENKQINLLKAGYSVVEMTKKKRLEIEESFIPSIMLGYALLGIKSSTKVNFVTISHGINTFDKSTGNPMIQWLISKKFDREKMLAINYDNILPSETIKLFEKVQPSDFDNLNWCDFNETFLPELPEIINTRIDALFENHIKFTAPQSFQKTVQLKSLFDEELMKVEKQLSKLIKA